MNYGIFWSHSFQVGTGRNASTYTFTASLTGVLLALVWAWYLHHHRDHEAGLDWLLPPVAVFVPGLMLLTLGLTVLLTRLTRR